MESWDDASAASESIADYSLAGTVSSYGENKVTIIPAIVPSEVGVGQSANMTPLMRAATLQDPSELLHLIASKEAVSTLFVKDGKGRTALDWARMCNNHLTIIALRKAMLTNIEEARVEIVRAPQDVDEKTKYANAVAHMKITEALKQRRCDKCIEIIAESKEIFERDDVERIEGETYFLDAGNHAGFTPLMLAATYNMPELVAMLLDFDVELEQQNKYGYTALSCACAGGHADIVRSLIFTGANLHHKTNEGRTGLHLACMYLKARVISVLLDFLFERFSVYRMKHPKYGFDSTRWTRYATMMEGYMDIKDSTGKTAWELLPLSGMHAAQLGTRLGAGLGDVALLLPADSPIKRERVNQVEQCQANSGERNGDDAGKDFDGDDDEGEGDDDNDEGDGDNDAADEEKETKAKRIQGKYKVPPALMHVDAKSIATLATHAKQCEDQKAAILLLQSSEIAVPPRSDMDMMDEKSPERMTSAGSLARPGGPLPYPPPAKAISAAEAVALMLRGELPAPQASSSSAVPPQHAIPGLDEEEGGGEDLGDASESLSVVSLQSSLSLSTLPDFSHDTDNFVAERANLTDSHSVLTAMALEEEVKIILLLSQQARDRIQGWRMAAEAEDILDQKVPCWLGCGFMESVEGVATHVRDLCPFRGKQCVGCRQIFKYIELQQHREKECPKRVVGCPNAYQGCVEMPTFEFLYQHTHLRCTFRKVPCRLNCGGMIAYCKRDDHEEVHCNRRGLVCELCGESVPALKFGRHKRDDCIERLVSCSVSCRSKFKAKDLHRHEQEECILPCKWACGRRIGPSELRGMHELVGCPRRPVTCKFNCHLGGLTAEFLAEHEKYQCPERFERCPNGCGDRVKRKDMPMHLDSWHGSCPERLVRCPSDYVGWKVYKVAAVCKQVTPPDCIIVKEDKEAVGQGRQDTSATPGGASRATTPSLVKSRLRFGIASTCAHAINQQ